MHLSLNNVSKAYAGRRVLHGIGAAFSRGEVVGVVGDNGAGKSTLLNCLAGSLNYQGQITLDAMDLRSIRNVVGAMPTEFPGETSWTVGQHLDAIALLKHADRRHIDYRIEQLGLADVRRRRVRDLSVGMRQRVKWLSCFLGNPDVLLLDEPTSGLSAAVHDEFFRDVQTAVGRGAVVMLSTHSSVELRRCANRILVLRRGSVAFDGSLRDYERMAGGSTVMIRVGDLDVPALCMALGDSAIARDGGQIAVRDFDEAKVGSIAHSLGIAVLGLATEGPPDLVAFASALAEGAAGR